MHCIECIQLVAIRCAIEEITLRKLLSRPGTDLHLAALRPDCYLVQFILFRSCHTDPRGVEISKGNQSCVSCCAGTYSGNRVNSLPFTDVEKVTAFVAGYAKSRFVGIR